MPKYTVVDTREVSTLTPMGSERKCYRVWIKTVHGATGSVDVPVDQWTAEVIEKELGAKAAELELAFNLNG